MGHQCANSCGFLVWVFKNISEIFIVRAQASQQYSEEGTRFRQCASFLVWWKNTDVPFKCHRGVNLRACHCRTAGETSLDADDDDFSAQETQSLSL